MAPWIMAGITVVALAALAWTERAAPKPYSSGVKAAMVVLVVVAASSFVWVLKLAFR